MSKVALVGLGDIGLRAHLPALLRGRDLHVAALVDPDPDRRALAAEAAPGVDLHDELGPVLLDPNITAVVLATPPWVTTRLAVEALKAGKFVLAEKPIATSVEAAEPLIRLPAQLRARLQVGFTYRHDPSLAVLRDAIRGHELGRSRLLIRAHIYDERRDPADREHAARVAAALRHGSPLLHDGAHVFDWLAFLLDGQRPRVADAWGMPVALDVRGHNLTGARLSYPDGTLALVEVGWWADVLPRCELSVLGDAGYAVLDGFTFRLTVTTAAGSQVYDPGVDRTTRCFDRQLAVFADLVAGRGPRAVPGVEEAMASLELSERIAASIEERTSA